jgi:acetyl-CoA acyltransferase
VEGREVVIVDGVRTAIGRGDPVNGYYRAVHPNELLGACYQAVLRRTGLSADMVEDVIVGCVQQIGEQSFNIARNAWLQAGLPPATPATTIDRQCGSAQQAVNFGAALIAAGVHDVVIAAGVEHMGRIPLFVGRMWEREVGTPYPPALYELHGLVDQGVSAELIAEEWDISRKELDELGLESHRRAVAAAQEGRFDREIVPFRAGGELRTLDQGLRPDTSLEALSKLRPVFKEAGRVTAGNASQISDGASSVLLVERRKADELGLTVRARIVDQTAVGVDPVLMLTGPIPATQKLLERNRMTLSDVDLFEVNEAFASVVIAWERELGADMDRVNVNGGAIALGHPLGSTGGRLVTTVVNELDRTDGSFGLVTMCCGGGLATATLIERL